MLVIRADLRDAIVEHALRDRPNEACGVLAGPEGSDRPERFIPVPNAAAAPDYPGLVDHNGERRFGDKFYEFSAADDFALYKELSARDEERVVVYHSHTPPDSKTYPSRIDIERAGEPQAHYVIAGVQDPDNVEFRSFRIVDGVVTEEEIEVVESYMFAHTGADDVPDQRRA